MAITYCIVFSLTLATVLHAFIKDTQAQGGIEAWIFISLAALLWPITLPFIISSKLRAYQDKTKQAMQSQSSQHSKEALL